MSSEIVCQCWNLYAFYGRSDHVHILDLYAASPYLIQVLQYLVECVIYRLIIPATCLSPTTCVPDIKYA